MSAICATNISGLGKAIIVYANEHNDTYPSADNWCDKLIKECDVDWRQFCSPADGMAEGKSSYAINMYIAGKKVSEVPPDTVILFETIQASNPVGGPEIISTKHHHGSGCYISFADGHTKFVNTQDLQSLRGKPE